MSSGRTHDRITLWCLPVVVLLSFRLTLNGWLTAWVCLGFLLGGWLLGPDLDIHSVQYKRWGCLRWIWLPYRGSMRHRSPLSHWPIVGTVVRVVYVMVWFWLLCVGSLALANEIFQLGLTWNDISQLISHSLQRHQAIWWAIGIGLELGALSHYLADWVVSTSRRVRKQYPKEGIRALRLVLGPPQKKRKTSRRRTAKSPTKTQTKPGTTASRTQKRRSPREPGSRAPIRKQP
ncbi:MAG: metal-binding protein [Cyanobacteriota bacterium]|nr:metal-binding protein [Cyanobacteriota bacterium]